MGESGYGKAGRFVLGLVMTARNIDLLEPTQVQLNLYFAFLLKLITQLCFGLREMFASRNTLYEKGDESLKGRETQSSRRNYVQVENNRRFRYNKVGRDDS